MSDDQLHLNGINGATGDYLFPPMHAETFAAFVSGEKSKIDSGLLDEVKAFWERLHEPDFAVIPGIDLRELSQTGWGVIFAHGTDPAVKEALKELLEHRRGQADRLFREFSNFSDRASRFDTPYEPPERKNRFLERNRVSPQTVDPEKMPYYLMIVGDPGTVPYVFQQEFDVQYATGRIWFEKDGKPDLDAFARYARSVVAAETDQPKTARRGVFFGVQNQGDRATQMSAESLVKPLATSMEEKLPAWKFDTVVGKEATKERLQQLLRGKNAPAFLFTASHGMGFPNGHPNQLAHQGALLCQDWPGVMNWGQRPIPPEHYFAADDVPRDARLQGLIAFFFACYGAGTPQYDEFAHRAIGEPTEIAPFPFLACLPQRLLSHDKGGALAVVGHVERAWSFSFWWGQAREQLTTFEATLEQLLNGFPVGAAVEYINEYHADLSVSLNQLFQDMHLGRTPEPRELSSLWTANNDARNYIILGDPAVRLAVPGE
jgi:hypothetical protein